MWIGAGSFMFVWLVLLIILRTLRKEASGAKSAEEATQTGEATQRRVQMQNQEPSASNPPAPSSNKPLTMGAAIFLVSLFGLLKRRRWLSKGVQQEARREQPERGEEAADVSQIARAGDD